MARRDIGFLAKAQIRSHVRRALRSGTLPPSAALVLDDDDAFETLCESVSDRAERVGAIGDGKILNWITANLPWILQVIMAILKAFDVPVPDLPPFPSPTPAPVSAGEFLVGSVVELGPPEWVARLEGKIDRLLLQDAPLVS